MDSVLETLTITVTLVTLFLPVALLTTYLIKRNWFYISVNCWFCNGWTKVLFAERNSFYCPFCLQYNGFNEDGGYNKIIKEQFDTSFNKPPCKAVDKFGTFSSNGLCAYCNYNQQLKVRQLASFVPLNDKNYDVEVEHFRGQLEKSYKLCKKCEKVLKKTIQKQNAWIFGNRIKSLQSNGLRLLNLNKSKRLANISKKTVIMNVIRYSLILLSLIVLSRALNESTYYPKSTVEQYMPGIFIPYTELLNDWCHIVSIAIDNFIKNMSNKFNLYLKSDLKDTRIIKNDILPITWVGLILEIILLTWHTKSVLWKTNELLGWITLIITSLSTFHENYFEIVNAVQIFCSIAIIYSILVNNSDGRKPLLKNKKYTFKKLKRNTEVFESSDEEDEIFEDLFNSSSCSKKPMSEKSYKSGNNFNTSCNSSVSQDFLFQNLLQNTTSNNAFATARSTKSLSVFNSSLKNGSMNSSSDELHHSLDNLHLTNLNFNSQSSASPVFSVNSLNRPILSPPKLKTITQNSWTAGGFWKNDVFSDATEVTNSSRSSSQSSGFVSCNEPIVPNTYYSLPPSRERSTYGDFEKTSILSEPTYHFTPINSSCTNTLKNNFLSTSSLLPEQCSSHTNQLYKTDNNIYPILKQNNMLLVQGNNIPRLNFEKSFSNLSLKNINASNRFHPPVLFSEKPIISSLFKNLPGVSPQTHTFRAPHC